MVTICSTGYYFKTAIFRTHIQLRVVIGYYTTVYASILVIEGWEENLFTSNIRVFSRSSCESLVFHDQWCACVEWGRGLLVGSLYLARHREQERFPPSRALVCDWRISKGKNRGPHHILKLRSVACTYVFIRQSRYATASFEHLRLS